MILGPINSGGYEDVLSFFVLYCVLQVTANWAEQEYWTHFKDIFGI
jgi:hypothetical protein